jgi:hypothetical protein
MQQHSKPPEKPGGFFIFLSFASRVPTRRYQNCRNDVGLIADLQTTLIIIVFSIAGTSVKRSLAPKLHQLLILIIKIPLSAGGFFIAVVNSRLLRPELPGRPPGY